MERRLFNPAADAGQNPLLIKPLAVDEYNVLAQHLCRHLHCG